MLPLLLLPQGPASQELHLIHRFRRSWESVGGLVRGSLVSPVELRCRRELSRALSRRARGLPVLGRPEALLVAPLVHHRILRRSGPRPRELAGRHLAARLSDLHPAEAAVLEVPEAEAGFLGCLVVPPAEGLSQV